MTVMEPMGHLRIPYQSLQEALSAPNPFRAVLDLISAQDAATKGILFSGVCWSLATGELKGDLELVWDPDTVRRTTEITTQFHDRMTGHETTRVPG